MVELKDLPVSGNLLKRMQCAWGLRAVVFRKFKTFSHVLVTI
jgi:hypothetical protein